MQLNVMTRATRGWRQFALTLATLVLAAPAMAVGTVAGTDIANTAEVSYELSGTPITQDSNTVTITVAETLDVALVLQSAQVTVAPGETGATLVYTLTNTGNGSEAFALLVDNSDAADDFDPVAQAPGIFFDTDGSGDLSAGDTAYVPGNNDPLLAPDATVTVIVVNDIPGGLTNGNAGRSSLVASADTGTGAPGTVFAGAGDGGVDAVVGANGASAEVAGEYVVSDVAVAINKAGAVTDPFGGSSPVPGATISYTITVAVNGSGTATAALVRDPIPANTTYTPGTLTLNGGPLSDAVDADVGEFDTTAVNGAVVVRLGDLTAADGVQTVEFDVVIN